MVVEIDVEPPIVPRLTESNIYYSRDLLGQIIMTLNETLKVLRMKEMETGHLLKTGLSLQRNYSNSSFSLPDNSDAFSLLAVNSKARIKWGSTFIREIFAFFGTGDYKDGPTSRSW